jgi:radical SAM protein with 4Fe4S-binding SPASM domain
MDPKATIKKNLKRRSVIVDDGVYFHEGNPMPTWVELSLIDVCNRKYTFCPKVDPKIAPDTYQKMTRAMVDKIHDQLLDMKYKGAIALCGYGEPLLHKDINYIVKKLSNVAPVEIITNGDVLTSKRLQDLYLADVNKVLISMYDGPEQIEKFNNLTKKANVPEDLVILRDRWYKENDDFGVKLTNRAGTIETGDQPSLTKYTKCFYPSYQFLIDWNGDVFLCPQDWQRRVTMGNIMQETVFNIWKGPIMTKYRKKLLMGDRSLNPCNKCNAEGTLLGKNHAVEWNKIYKQS